MDKTNMLTHTLLQLIRDYGRARFDNRGDAVQKYMEEIKHVLEHALKDQNSIKERARLMMQDRISSVRDELVGLGILDEERGWLQHEGRKDALTLEAELMFHGKYFMAQTKQKLLEDIAKEFEGCSDSLTGDQLAALLRAKGSELVDATLPKKG